MRTVIAVDFDGTLCRDEWPLIGEPMDGTIAALLERQRAGARLVLWTCREGAALLEALEWARARGITFDAVNANLPEVLERFGGDTRKIYADEYWDDRAVATPWGVQWAVGGKR